MTKPTIDMSVLPDGMLIESRGKSLLGGHEVWHPNYMDSMWRTYEPSGIYRPALSYWHFNDGYMVLPDGLVVEFQIRAGTIAKGVTATQQKGSGAEYKSGNLINHLEFCFNDSPHSLDIIAVKILGLHPDYSHLSEQYGMEIVEV